MNRTPSTWICTHLAGAAIALVAATSVACGSADDGEFGAATLGDGPLGPPSSNDAGESDGSLATGDGAIGPDGTRTPPIVPSTPGSPGCGLPSAAFCDDFASPVAQSGRTGDLDPARWSVARIVGENASLERMLFPATPVSACQIGVSQVSVGDDLAICDTASGHAGQLLTALGAQNYALLSMRPRVPFDFAGRVGVVTFDVDAVTQGGLSFWPSVFVTDRPDTLANNAAQVLGLLPENGIGFNFDGTCGVNDGSLGGLGGAFVYANAVESALPTSGSTCFKTQRGSLNRFEVHLGAKSVELFASDYSTDGGKTFPNFRKIFGAAIDLSFTRGWVHYQVGQRAPKKYASQFGISPGYANYYWSRLGFDGPVYGGERGAALPDSLVGSGADKSVGYVVPGTFDVPAVDPTGATAARLTFAVSYTYTGGLDSSNAVLRYKLNDGAVTTPPQPSYVKEETCSGCPGPTGGGGVLYSFVVPVSELKKGTNKVTLSVDGAPASYPPILTSLEILTFSGATPP